MKGSDPELLRQILQGDNRFAPDAYVFLEDALRFTVKMTGKPASGPTRHVSGGELLEGIRKYAIKQFGPMTKTVLNSWGVRRTEDFGAMVFKMVEKGWLKKNERDSISDFGQGYDFDTAFRKPFEPLSEASRADESRA